MALTGILFGAVVIMWGVFLVPWALRRYDEATSVRPIETFSDAMRVLRRTEEPGPSAATQSAKGSPATPSTDAAASGASVARPASATATSSNSGASVRIPAPAAVTATSGASVRTPPRAAARAAAARRRRVLLALLGVTVVVGVLAALALLPWWAPVIAAVVIVAWLVVCRVQVRREEQAAWARRRATVDPADHEDTVRIAARSAPGGSAAGTVAPARSQPPAAAPVHEPVAPSGTPTPSAPAERVAPVSAVDLAEGSSVAVPVTGEDGSSLWDPLPVTLPKYVTKPRATPSIRTVDLGAPRAWSSGHVEGEQTQMPASGASTKHARAVGD